MRMTVDVNSNGSGTYGAAIGLTEEAKSLLGSQGEDPYQLMTKAINATSEMELTRWTDGDYEWAQGTLPFDTLDEINKRMSQSQIFESFSIIRQRGLFKDKFTLEATINPLSDLANEAGSSDISGMDPSSFIALQLGVNLPGKVTETNGVLEDPNSTQMVWTAVGNNQVYVNATSQAWNWAPIVAIFLVVGLVVVIIIAIVIFSIFSLIRKKKKANIPSDSFPIV